MDERPRGARRFLEGAVSGLAAVAARPVRLLRRAGGPLARLWRLVSLKAAVDGGVPATTQFDGAVETGRRLRLELGPHCRLGRRVFLETCEEGRITLGANVRVNAGTFIVAYAEISIGSDSLIGEYVSLRDADHGLGTDRPIRLQPHAASPIRIGEGVWIGRGAVILKGVTIGAGAVVAANSVVTRDVRPFAIVAGVPAKELRLRGSAGAP
ncbi:MAG: acyltransferase [Anaeromyxobacter sp.]|nr:acyltransferase [Anaeromyxobacter sp.]